MLSLVVRGRWCGRHLTALNEQAVHEGTGPNSQPSNGPASDWRRVGEGVGVSAGVGVGLRVRLRMRVRAGRAHVCMQASCNYRSTPLPFISRRRRGGRDLGSSFESHTAYTAQGQVASLSWMKTYLALCLSFLSGASAIAGSEV